MTSVYSLINSACLLGAGLYLLASFRQLQELRRAADSTGDERVASQPLLLVPAMLLHAGSVWLKLTFGEAIDVNIFNLFALLALVIVLITWLLNRQGERYLLQLVLFPIAAMALVLLVIPHTPIILDHLDALSALHVISSLLAYTLLSICALLALHIALHHQLLKQHRGGWLFARIPLTATEKLLFQLMLLGVVLLSFSLLSGLLFVDNLMAQHLIHKTIFSILAWVIFSTLLIGRWRLGWRGMLAVKLTLLGMTLLLLGYFGSKLVLEVILQRDWQL